MNGAIYTGTTGLIAFTKGLDNISSNVSNLNTPGYKGRDLLFRDLYYDYQLTGENNGSFTSQQLGNGVDTGSSSIRFTQGEVRETGVSTDAAIDGQGFFVLRDGDNTYYTRAGQFQFDTNGYLVARGNGARVAGLHNHDALSDININGYRTYPPKATTTVEFRDNLSTGSTAHTINDLVVNDAQGNEHTLTVTFTNNSTATPRSWLIQVSDSAGNIVLNNSEIRFQGDGSPEVDFNTVAFTFSPANADALNITFDFGEPGSFTNVTSFSGGTTSTMKVSSQDGASASSITEVSFDSNGVFTAHYSNGETLQGPALALAWFNDVQALNAVDGGRFTANGNQVATIAHASQKGLGNIVGGSIELSNVELTQQFTDLIIVQRGYQASSQVITSANEMIQQLLQAVGRK
jgi:flagellar hook protein FlgE